ncbi:pectinesterase family protein [Streptomyces fuscichromogenes]|uniref:pectinesterase family protein n=1 Tax=Streptomyces fuscichromogenes TaxID=1324013 RepID=UPI0037F771E9
MTTTAPGGLPRRSFLAAASAVALTAAGGLVLTSAPLASATDDEPTAPNASWTITSEAAEDRAGYARMINSIRRAIRAGQVRSEDTVPAVDVTDAAGTSSYIRVDLHVVGVYDFIRVFLRRSDSYVMRWRWGTTDVDNSNVVYWRRFFTLDSTVNLPNAVRGEGGNVVPRFEDLTNYSDLAQQGATRDGMQITPSSLSNAVLTLVGGQSATTRNAAQSILQVIVAVAEGSRFRNQAAETATAFGNSVPFTVSSQHVAQQNNWANLSRAFLTAVVAGAVVLAAPVEVGVVVFATTAAVAQVLMTAYHSNVNSRGRQLTAADDTTLYIQPGGFGDFPTIQDAVDAAPSDGVQRTVLLAKGIYNEAVVVAASRSNLFIKAEQGVAASDVVITAERAHGMTDPATGQPYGTEGSAVLTVKAPGVTVGGVTVQNTFDPAKHPEVDAYSTQAVAVAAEGDRQTYTQCRIIARQDTVLCKAPVVTGQYRQYFVGCYVEGAIDFVFGNATAVFDQCNIAMRNWAGGTVLAPNTDKSQKYGILITGSEIFTNGVPEKTMYLGRPWHNSADAWPQAVVRDTTIHSGVNSAQPWTDMTPDYSWSSARFHEYNNYGVGSGGGTNAPQLTDSQAADYTARKYLAGSDGWNPVYSG